MKLWALALLLAIAPQTDASTQPAGHIIQSSEASLSTLTAPSSPSKPLEIPQQPVASFLLVQVTRVSAEAALSLAVPLASAGKLGAAEGHAPRIDRPPTASSFLPV